MKRRDITLGEMQDECKFRGDNCETVGGDRCKFFEVCATMQTIEKGCLTPIMWNLTDPPRFTEAQMALLKGLYACGCVTLIQDEGITAAQSKDGDAMWFGKMLNLKSTETLDLAELLGKDGA